ncbi:hypothetical protein Tco_1166764 [Tanacetum coccineum]
MADAEHAPAMAPPVRTDEQILPRIRWVPIGKSNCYLNEEKSQPSPIYKIAVDILKQTNFFRAFTASSTIPAIYIQQFWDTICFDSKAGSYKCQLDEQWFDLTKDTLRDALQITPVDNNRAFSPPPTPDTLIDFVNELGYPKEVIHLSNVTTNDMFQPWRALTTIINLCLTGKTSGFENGPEPFTKLIIFHLQQLHNFHPRPESPLHLPTEEPVLGHLKFSAKGSKREVFGMTIPNELINDVIRGADYYDAYLEKVAKHQRYITGKELSDPDSPAPKPAKPTKQDKPKAPKQTKSTEPKAATKKSKPAPAKPQEKKYKPVSEPLEVSPLAKRAKAGKLVKKRTVKSSKQLVDKFIDEGVPAATPRLEDTEEAILQKVPGKGKEKVGEEQAGQVLLHLQTPKKKSPAEQYIFQRHTPIPSEPAGHEESSSLYAELGLSGSDTESDEGMPLVVRSGAQDEGQAGPDPGKLDEGQARPNPDDVAESQPLPTLSVLAGPNLEHSDVETTDLSQPQPAHLAEKGKDFSFGDQFFNDKPSDAENEKTTAEYEVESMVSSPPARPPCHPSYDITGDRVSVLDSFSQSPLRARFKDLPTSNMKEFGPSMLEEKNYDKGHADHRVAYEALQVSIHRDVCEDFDVDKAQEETKKKRALDNGASVPAQDSSTTSVLIIIREVSQQARLAPRSQRQLLSAEYSGLVND